MHFELLNAWREPLRKSWHDDAKLLLDLLSAQITPNNSDLNDVAARLTRLANARLEDIEKLRARRLARLALPLADKLPGFRKFRVLFVSNRTLSYFAADLEVAGIARGILFELVESDFDSVANLALNPSAVLPTGTFDAVFLLVDEGFFPDRGNLLDGKGEAAVLASATSRLHSIISGLKAKFTAPVVAASIAPKIESRLAAADVMIPGTVIRLIRHINDFLVALAGKGEIVLFDLAGFSEQVGTGRFHDPVRYYQAKTPFALDIGLILADRLAAQIAAMCGRSGRVLVLDLDNTIWGGVVADDGINNISLGQGSPDGEAFQAVQRYALSLRERGIILAVCSKNFEEIAREPFRRHPEMLLREEHIASFVANFEDKATNLSRIASSLDLDPSSLVFLDDNPAERERVRSSLPTVKVPELGSDPSYYVSIVISSGYFEQLAVTQDDLLRANAYNARNDSAILRNAIGNYDEYLLSLDMTLIIRNFDRFNRTRISQLINKSNQFNLTTRRYSEVQTELLENDNSKLSWFARLKDRFADHGIVSIIIIEKHERQWVIDTWIMSCRVLERGVEKALMNAVIAAARLAGVSEIIGKYKPTERNGLVENFYPQFGFESVSIDADTVYSYSLKVDIYNLANNFISVDADNIESQLNRISSVKSDNLEENN